jgi:hypothetical protein
VVHGEQAQGAGLGQAAPGDQERFRGQAGGVLGVRRGLQARRSPRRLLTTPGRAVAVQDVPRRRSTPKATGRSGDLHRLRTIPVDPSDRLMPPVLPPRRMAPGQGATASEDLLRPDAGTLPKLVKSENKKRLDGGNAVTDTSLGSHTPEGATDRPGRTARGTGHGRAHTLRGQRRAGRLRPGEANDAVGGRKETSPREGLVRDPGARHPEWIGRLSQRPGWGADGEHPPRMRAGPAGAGHPLRAGPYGVA